MIDIAKLTKEDVGKWVEFIDIVMDDVCFAGKRKKERGRIKSWNDKYIFVVYRCNGEWDRFEEFTGVATNLGNLEFVEGGQK